MLNRPLREVQKLAMRRWLYSPHEIDYLNTRSSDFLLRLFSKKDQRLERILGVICNAASKKGFVFSVPRIRVVRKGIKERLIYRRNGEVFAEATTYGLAVQGKIILILWKEANNLTEMELAVLIAHEFGHILDFQTKREGHPLFNNVKHVDKELFADAIAAYLYTKLVVKTAYKRMGVKIDDMAFYNLDLKA